MSESLSGAEFKKQLREGKPKYGLFINSHSPTVVEQLAFSAREDKRIDKRSGVSQRLPISVLENVISNAERRALVAGESVAVPRVLDVYAALPSITGKLELEYEGELKGGDAVARELIRLAVGKVLHLGSAAQFGRRQPQVVAQ